MDVSGCVALSAIDWLSSDDDDNDDDRLMESCIPWLIAGYANRREKVR